MSTFWDEQEITLRRPAANLFRFSPDYAQREAGLGAYAYHQLGWRRAAIVAGDQTADGAAPRLSPRSSVRWGARSSRRRTARRTRAPRTRSRARSPRGPTASPRSSTSSTTPRILSSLASRLGDARRLLVWGTNLEDAALLGTLGGKLDGVVGTTWLPASPASSVLRDYRRGWRAAFPGLPAPLADQSAVIGYYNSVEATLTALERVHSTDVGAGLSAELRRLRLDLPDGSVSDRNRQAVRDGYLSRVVVAGGKPALEPVRVVHRVDQSFAGLLSSAPPPGPGTQPCRRALPPAWAR